MNHEYRIKETIGPYWNRRYELQEKYLCGIDNKGNLTYGWHMVMWSSEKKFCEEALQKRLDRIKQGLEPTLYEQRCKEFKERKQRMIDTECNDELPWW